MRLAYKAVDGKGKTVENVIEAPGFSEALETLRRDGLFVTDLVEARGRVARRRTSRAKSATAGQRMKRSHLLMFTRQMAMLLQAGSPVVPALAAIGRHLRGRSREIIDDIRGHMERGRTLTECLRDHPETFSDSYTAIVGAGEQSANLDTMFLRLAKLVGDSVKIRNRVIGALAYPALLVVLSIGIVTTMLTAVIPRFVMLFESLDVPLPWLTAFLVMVSTALRTHSVAVVASLAILVIGGIALCRTAPGRQWLCDIQTRIPLYGRLVVRLQLARMFRVMGLLLESRVAMMDMLELARRMSRNRDFRDMFDRVHAEIEAGGRFSDGLARSRLMTPSLGQAVTTGEESGRLDQAMLFVADVLDEENEQLLATATKLIEPVILIGMGATVGGIALSLFIPLFDLAAAS